MSFKAEEVNIVVTRGINAPPLEINKGAGIQDKDPGILMAQYPASRAESLDSGRATELNSLYTNGLLFTAYNYTPRTTTSLRNFRKEKNKHSILTYTKGETHTFDEDAIANILMPKSQSDVDVISHKFNDVQDSLSTRAGSIGTNILSNIASNAVFGSIESITQGAMADYGEQVHSTARSMYAGPDNRTKIYSWQLTPRSVTDLIEIIKIYEIFAYMSYGKTGVSGFSKDLKSKLDDWYKNTFLNTILSEDVSKEGTIFEGITSFLSNVITVTNPIIWIIKNFGKTSSFDGRSDVFGPAQISNIRFDKSSDGKFRGLAIAPNLPSSFMLEITFREIMTLNQNSIFNEGIEL